MARRSRPVAMLVALVAAAGCSRGSPPGGAAGTAASSAAVASGAPSASAAPLSSALGPVAQGPRLESPAVFSAPIAAARTGGAVVVAGLVAADGVIRVMGLAEGAGPAWAVDALLNVAWAPDAELKLQAAPAGLALVWRGLVGGKAGSALVVLGPHGEALGDAAPAGASVCATDRGVAWTDPHGAGPVHVRARSWSAPAVADVATVPADRAPTLVCAEHQAFLLGDGDDDLTATTFVPGEDPEAGAPARTITAIRDQDFGEDDEREHEAFTIGDDLGLVRVGDSGAVAVREISGGKASPWRRLKHALSADDDVVAVDGDSEAIVVVSTHEGRACPGSESGAQSVRALRLDRKTGDEAAVVLAPDDCANAPGPFWVVEGPGAPGGAIVAWAEHRAHAAPTAVPIEHLSYRALAGGAGAAASIVASPAAVGRLDAEADALVDAGCDATGCYAAALFRQPGAEDASKPGPIVALRYPSKN